MAEALLEARQLKKYFAVTRGMALRRFSGWLQAVDGVSFEIASGETLALVGESGCGKSTTARLILLLEKLTAGSIFFEGREVGAGTPHMKEFRRGVQAVFQDPWSSLNPRMRVGNIVAEPLLVSRSLSRASIRDRVAELLTLVGLRADDARLYPHQFSGGQRQRIAIARALSVQPKLIVLDEPVSGLDVSIRAQVLNLLRDLQTQTKISYLFIAHDLAPVRYISQRVGVMYLGQIVESGPTSLVLSNPLHPYTKGLRAAAEAENEATVEGEPPSPINPPAGCRFHTRCPYVMPLCSTTMPAWQQIDGRQVACHLYSA